jgi:hypothetical protein
VEHPAATGIKHTSNSKNSLQLGALTELFWPEGRLDVSSTLPRNVNLQQINSEEYNAYSARSSGKYFFQILSSV